MDLYFDLANNLQLFFRSPHELRQPFLLDAMLSIIHLLDTIMHLLDNLSSSLKAEADAAAVEVTRRISISTTTRGP